MYNEYTHYVTYNSITEGAVTGLAVLLSLTLAGVIVAILIVTIFMIMKRRMSQNTDNAFIPSNGI